MRLGIVDPSGATRRAVEQAIVSGGYVVAWSVADAAEALHRTEREPVDLVLLGVSVSDRSPAELTRELVTHRKAVVVLLADDTRSGLSKVYEAMGAGAAEVIPLSLLTTPGSPALSKKLRTIGRLIRQASSTSDANRPAVRPGASRKLIAIGSSTGGPQALLAVLSALPRNLSAAIVIVQHVDGAFAGGLAEWLSQSTGIQVQVAKNGAPPLEGGALLAGTHDHLVMTAGGTFRYTSDPREAIYRPSVDVLFSSLAEHWDTPSVGVLLTGMGKDGAQGLRKLRQVGWHTIAQDEASSVVYGMPKAAAKLGAACKILPPDAIGREIGKHLAR